MQGWWVASGQTETQLFPRESYGNLEGKPLVQMVHPLKSSKTASQPTESDSYSADSML